MDAAVAAFSPRTDAALARAASACAQRGAKLTDLRRDVLGLILEAPGPTGAYDLLERLRARRGGAAPPTVYRALDFLLEQRLIHRIERLAAFVDRPPARRPISHLSRLRQGDRDRGFCPHARPGGGGGARRIFDLPRDGGGGRAVRRLCVRQPARQQAVGWASAHRRKSRPPSVQAKRVALVG